MFCSDGSVDMVKEVQRLQVQVHEHPCPPFLPVAGVGFTIITWWAAVPQET